MAKGNALSTCLKLKNHTLRHPYRSHTRHLFLELLEDRRLLAVGPESLLGPLHLARTEPNSDLAGCVLADDSTNVGGDARSDPVRAALAVRTAAVAAGPVRTSLAGHAHPRHRLLASAMVAGPSLTVSPGQVFFLKASPPPHELNIRLPTNVNAADTTNTDVVQPGGSSGLDLTGSGYTVGVWEVGGTVRASHQEFGSRVTVVDSGGATDHATHVAGTIGASGVVASAKGMATEVSIRSRDEENDIAELDADANLIQVSNHSYSFINGWVQTDTSIVDLVLGDADIWFGDRAVQAVEDTGFGQYNSVSRDLDEALHDNANLLSVWSAGNDRNDSFTNLRTDDTYVTYLSSDPGNVAGFMDAGWYLVSNSGATSAPGMDGNGGTGFDSIPGGGQTAKNGLTVGAINQVTVDPVSGVSITGFSSVGPEDDGRIKPDVVGDGGGLYSTNSGSDSAYGISAGTSMSAPNVAGSAVLLTEHFEDLHERLPRAATLKGAIVHTAYDAGNAGPDYTFGWGLMDTAAAASFMTNAAAGGGSEVLVETAYAGSEWTLSVEAGGAPLKASLVWHDPSSTTLSSGLDDATSVLVNDLDIWITDESDTVYRPWTLNPLTPTAAAVRTSANHRDNTEQVLIDAPSTGTYTIHVDAAAGVTSQDFSLLVSGGDTLPEISDLSPADNSNDVDTGTNLVITFNEDIAKGTGNILIKRASDNSVAQSVDVTTAAVSIAGAVATIDPASDLESSTGYYVEVPSGVFEDLGGNDFPGITTSDAWNFTTASPASLVVTISADAVSEAGGSSDVTITRSGADDSQALTVSLDSSDESEATVPNDIEIPANESSVTVTLNAVDDGLIDGTRTVTITASATGFTSGTDTVDVTDDEAGWAQRHGQDGQGDDSPNDEFDAVVFDDQGNLVAGGSLYGFKASGTQASDADILVTKFDEQGTLVWEYSVGSLDDEGDSRGDDDDRVQDLAIDSQGNIFVVGAFRNTVDFDPLNTHSGDIDILSSSGVFDGFLLKLTPEGQFVSVRQIGGTSGIWDYAHAIAIDDQDNVFVGGQFAGTVDFDRTQTYGDNRDIKNASQGDGFIVKYDSAGDFVWARHFGGGSHDYPVELHLGSQGHVYASGVFQTTADFDRGNSYGDNRDLVTVSGTNGGDSDAFIATWDNDGNFVWVRSFGGNFWQQPTSLTLDSANNIFATGLFQNTVDFDPGAGVAEESSVSGGFDIFVLKLTVDGDFDWVRTAGSTGDDRGLGITINADGNLVVVGQFAATVDFDPTAATAQLSAHGTDGFAWTLSPAGSAIDAKRYGGSGTDVLQGVESGAGGKLALGGFFATTAQFDVGDALVDLTSVGGADAFAASVMPDTLAPVVTAASLVTNDTTPGLTGTIDDPFATIQVTVNESDYAAANEGNGLWTLPDNTLAALAQGIYNVQVVATDASGNVSSDATDDELIIDLAEPSTTLTHPVDGGFYNVASWSDAVTGTSADTGGASVDVVKVSIQRLSDNKFWTGSAFASDTAMLVDAAGTTSWSAPLEDSHLTDGVSYRVAAHALDTAGNEENPATAVATFTFSTSPPTISVLSPPNGADDVAVDTDLVITFDKDVQKGAGNILIKTYGDNAVVQTIDVTDAAVTVAGAVATINPPNDLSGTEAYYVEIASGAFADPAGNDFPGITGDETWGFATVGDLLTVQLVPVAAPTAANATDLPTPVSTVSQGSEYFVEVWLQTVGTSGITGGRVDVNYTTALVDSSTSEIVHADFDITPSGVVDDAAGLVDDLGGATFSATRGIAPQWARLAYFGVEATANGTAEYSLSEGNLQFAIVGEGNVSWQLINLSHEASVEQVGAGQLDIAVVRSPTATDANGEVASLPASESWIHEWEPYYVEVWAGTPGTTALDVNAVLLDLSYNTNITTATEITFGTTFSENQSGTIDDAAGTISALGATTPSADLGDDAHVLVARVRFEPTGTDQVEVDEAGHSIGPAGLNLVVSGGQLDTGGGLNAATTGTEPDTDMVAVVYDIDDNNQIDNGDLAFFTPAFGLTVGASEPPFTWWADFDKSNLVDFGDFAFLAPNFEKQRPATDLVFPANFPAAWLPAGGFSGAAAEEPSPESGANSTAAPERAVAGSLANAPTADPALQLVAGTQSEVNVVRDRTGRMRSVSDLPVPRPESVDAAFSAKRDSGRGIERRSRRLSSDVLSRHRGVQTSSADDLVEEAPIDDELLTILVTPRHRRI